MTLRRCEDLRELVRDFVHLGSWLEEYNKDLGTLVDDHVLLLGRGLPHPWKIRFVVDFREIYMYVFPFSDVLRNYGKATTDAAYLRKAALDYFARACLFKHTWLVGDLYLLAPYQYELNHSLLTYLPQRTDEGKLVDLVSKLSGNLAAPIRESLLSGGAGDVVSMLSRHYMDLSLLLLADQETSAHRIDDILKRKIAVPPADSLLTKAVPDPEVVDAWASRLSWYRKGRKPQSRRDAEAIATIQQANKLAAEQGQNELFVLVTSTESIHSVIRNPPGLEIDEQQSYSEPIPIRSLGHMLVYLKNLYGFDVGPNGTPSSFDEANTTVLSNLQKSRGRAAEFLSLSEVSARTLSRCPCWRIERPEEYPGIDCPLRSIEPRVELSLAELEETREEIENSQLILKNHSDLDIAQARILAEANPSRFDEQLGGLLEAILDGEQMKEAVVKQIHHLVDTLVMGLMGFNAQVVTYSNEISDSRLHYISEFPFYVTVEDTELRALLASTAEEVDVAAVSGETERVSTALRTLVSRMHDLHPSSADRLVVELLILLAMGDTHLLLQLVNRCLSMNAFEYKADLEYLRVRATFDLDTEEAQGLCAKALARNPRDARFHLISGALWWKVAVDAENDVATGLREAIEVTAQGIAVADEASVEDVLICDLLNNYAFFCAQSTRLHLERAEEAILRMLKIRDLGNWRSSWLDTYGCVLLRRIDMSDMMTASVKREKVLEAISMFEQALIGFASSSTKVKIGEHMSQALELIR